MDSQDDLSSSQRPLKRRKITRDWLPTSPSKENVVFEPLIIEGGVYSQSRHLTTPKGSNYATEPFRPNDASTIASNSPKARLESRPLTYREDVATIIHLNLTTLPPMYNGRAENEDVVETSDIEELPLSEDRNILSSPQPLRLLRTSSYSEGRPDNTSPPISITSKSRSPVPSFSSEMDQEHFELSATSVGVRSPSRSPRSNASSLHTTQTPSNLISIEHSSRSLVDANLRNEDRTSRKNSHSNFQAVGQPLDAAPSAANHRLITEASTNVSNLISPKMPCFANDDGPTSQQGSSNLTAHQFGMPSLNLREGPISRQASPSSSSLSSIPPSPPRRRTRESNKKFTPYTDYIRQYGKAEIERLEREERKNMRRQGSVDQDDVWLASQTQQDEESQTVPSNPREESERNISGIKRKRRDHAPQPQLKRNAVSTAISSTDNHQREKQHSTTSSIGKHSENLPVFRRLPPTPSGLVSQQRGATHANAVVQYRPSEDAINKALEKLYEDDSDSDEERADPFTVNPAVGIAKANRMDVDIPTEDEEESQFPVYRPRSYAPIVADDDDDDDDGSGENSHESPIQKSPNNRIEVGDPSDREIEEDEDDVDRERQRILARVWPAVMIKRNEAAARAKELERQRKDRDEERARRARLNLSGSDAADDMDAQGPSIVPGQSRIRRLGSVEPTDIPNDEPGTISEDEGHDRPRTMERRRLARKEVIDISSDQESLDNDEVMEERRLGSISSSDESAPLSSELEAVEDNTIRDYRRYDSRINGLGSTFTGRRRANRWNSRRPMLRQTRIDRMLNSTRHKSSNSRRTGRERRDDKHQRSRHSFLPPNTHMVIASTPHQIQTRLPFHPVQNDDKDKDSKPKAHGKHRPKAGASHRLGSSSNYNKDRSTSSRNHAKRVPKELLPDVFDVLAPANRLKSPLAEGAATTHLKSLRHPKSKAASSSKLTHSVGRSHLVPSSTTGIEDPYDPDAKIDISLRTALAFGARRSRVGFKACSSSWITQGRLLDLVHVLCGRSAPSEPLPCHISTLHLTVETSIPDLQVQFPTICDLLFDMISQKARPGQDLFIAGQNLMRFVCLFVSWMSKNDTDEAKDMLQFVRAQIGALMERVEEWIKYRNRTGQDFNHGLFSIHWFAVEISNRITAALVSRNQRQDEVVLLNDSETDRYTIKLMSRLLEYGPRRAGQALQANPTAVEGEPSVAEYALELWIALIHVITLLPESDKEFTDTSTTFWRLLVDALDQTNRPFASAVHESEFIFATIFTLSSISSIDILGFGQEERRLRAYWPIVCHALSCINLAPDNDKQRLPQHIVAAKDTYIGMLFARCNVLAFRWDWSLQEPQHSKQLFHALREALKNRKFMNLIHEQSDFPSFIVRQDLTLLHEFDPKDSIQTILIKLMIRRAQTSPEGLPSAKKWISLLASTSSLEFKKDNPPTQKELSALFNQFTIKLVLLYITPDPNNVRVLVNNSKNIVGFKDADLRSRQVCVRAGMIFGRLCQSFGLSPEEPIKWLAEMGDMVLAEWKLTGTDVTSRQVKDTGLLCALIVASVRDILNTRPIDEDQSLAFPSLPSSIIGFIVRLLPFTTRLSACLPEIALLIKVTFDFRSTFVPPPQLPQIPVAVVEEESQGDYGFEPIDVNDPSLIQAFAADLDLIDSATSDLDLALSKVMAEFISPVATLVGRLGHADQSERNQAESELWMDCWARIGAISVKHGLKEWEHFIQRRPAALGRVEDFDWQQEMEPIFMLRILREDPRAYEPHKGDFLKIFFVALIARDSDLLPSYIWTVLHVDGMRHPFFKSLPFLRDTTEQEFEEHEFADTRLEIVEAVLRNADQAYQDMKKKTDEAMKLGAEAIENVASMLKNLRHNILTQQSQQPPRAGLSEQKPTGPQGGGGRRSFAESEYVRFSSNIVSTLRGLGVHAAPRISPFLHDLGFMDLTADD